MLVAAAAAAGDSPPSTVLVTGAGGRTGNHQILPLSTMLEVEEIVILHQNLTFFKSHCNIGARILHGIQFLGILRNVLVVVVEN